MATKAQLQEQLEESRLANRALKRDTTELKEKVAALLLELGNEREFIEELKSSIAAKNSTIDYQVISLEKAHQNRRTLEDRLRYYEGAEFGQRVEVLLRKQFRDNRFGGELVRLITGTELEKFLRKYCQPEEDYRTEEGYLHKAMADLGLTKTSKTVSVKAK